KHEEQKMEETKYKEEQQIIQNLKTNMLDYMEFGDPPYSKKDVEKCEEILSEFMISFEKTTSKKEGSEVIKLTIIKLNELNKKCEYQLIETGEREQIAEMMISIGHKKGYNKLNEDITEEWREW